MTVQPARLRGPAVRAFVHAVDTGWTFTVGYDGRIARFETGQA
ncbi:hypothetical protein ACWER6_06865 [Streptomyces sp. NPDC004009]